ncbi:MAG: hypothetical protein EOP49_13245, partial [Sphingobacteriales bacterium]
ATQFPAAPVMASAFNDTIVVSTSSQAGQYFRVEQLQAGQTYRFTSSGSQDYLTIRDATSNVVVGQGTAVVDYVAGAGVQAVNVHINLISPPCGTEAVNRTTKMVCSSCTATPAGVGVGTASPVAALDVAGEIRLGNVTRTPSAGMVRWNAASQDFEGYNGSDWLSLTKSRPAAGTWGEYPAPASVNESGQVTSGDGLAQDLFGYSVSTHGDYTIIGAPYANIGAAADRGAAYVFFRNGNAWLQQAKLVAADGAANDNFGIAVSINGNYAIIGAPYDNTTGIQQGSAYIFMRSGTTWTQQAKITASDMGAYYSFGGSVSINGDYVVVGSAGADGAGLTQGAAYVFVRSGSTWSQQAKLTASDGLTEDYFGVSVAISGNYAIIGANGDDVGANVDQGSAYIFMRNGSSWAQQAKVVGSSAGGADAFGTSVAMDGDYAIVGAPWNDVGGNADQGAAYVFLRNGTNWAQQARLLAADGATDDFFGYSASIQGNYALVGSHKDNIGAISDQGSAYLFNRNGSTWAQQLKITASDGTTSDELGLSVSIGSQYAVIAAYAKDQPGVINQGAVYFIRKH